VRSGLCTGGQQADQGTGCNEKFPHTNNFTQFMAKHLKRKGEKGGMTATGKDQLAISKVRI